MNAGFDGKESQPGKPHSADYGNSNGNGISLALESPY
jgi:hypothetical protein